jgi:hypothetical protein
MGSEQEWLLKPADLSLSDDAQKDVGVLPLLTINVL